MPSSACDWSSDVCSSDRSEEHTSELQSRSDLVCRLLLEKKKENNNSTSSLESRRRAAGHTGMRCARPRKTEMSWHEKSRYYIPATIHLRTRATTDRPTGK